MDGFELNKYLGAATGALMVFMLTGWLSESLYHTGGGHHKGEAQLFYAQPAEDVAPEDGGEEGGVVVSLAGLVSDATADQGAKVFRKCAACHKVEEGAAHGVGPALWGVMGRAVGGAEGYNYSAALADKGGDWTWEAMDGFLTKPADWAPGTKMGFAGLKKPEDRAAVMVYLNEYGAEPLPQPEADAAAPGDSAAAPAESAVDESAAAPAESAADESAAAAAAVETIAAAAPAAGDGASDALATLVASADIDDGKKVFRKCVACHKAEDGAPHGVGPNLYSVVGADIAAAEGYNYSSALSDKGGAWDLAALDAFLTKPRDFAPGTKMGFAGLKKAEDRAAVIAYLNQQSANPVSLP